MTRTHTFTHSSVFPCSPEELYAWHSRQGALERLLPPWDKSYVLSRKGGITPGGEVFMKMFAGPIPYTWHARHIEDQPGIMFKDIQHKGPFSSWTHTHRFFEDGDGCRLEDHIEYALPLHSMLPAFTRNMVDARLRRIFTYRHQTLNQDIQLHNRYSRTPLRILITGGSGILGTALKPLLTTGGHAVWSLVRRTPKPGANEIYWNPEKDEIDTASFPELDGVIHLAGDNIGQGRWTENKKQRVIDSRVQGTGLIARTVANMSPGPRVLLSASAVGFYGNCEDCCMREEDQSGLDFISDVCSLWECAARPAEDAGIRTVFMRIGVVLSPRGGALQRLLTTANIGFAKSFGSGEQYISWISIDDMISVILHALATESLHGPVNIAAPTPATNRELMQALAHVVNRPLLPSIPAGFLKKIYGQMASEVLLSGCRVSTDKLQLSGYRFRHPDLTQTLQVLLGKQ